MIEAKAFKPIRVYSLMKSKRLSANIKSTVHKAFIREFAADTYLLKLQRLQNKILHTTGNFQK